MKKTVSLLLALACLLAAVGCTQTDTTRQPSLRSNADARQLAAPVYPEMAPYPDESKYFNAAGLFDSDEFDKVYDAWRADVKTQQDQPEGYADGLDPFFAQSISTYLTNTTSENRVYSPLNLYMALAMLAEVTDGESRRQVLDLLGSDSIDALRRQATALWNANYRDDGAVTSILASSLWLNEDVTFVQETMDRLADTYYASSFQGEMGSASFNKALQNWLSEQTGGLLAEQAAGVEMSPETILALATTLYFRAKWTNEFNEANTREGQFSLLSPDGDTLTCDFMHQSTSRNYYWGEKFSAVSQPLEGSCSMWFLLPDEGVSVNELLTDEQAMDFLLSDGGWDNSKFLTVNLAVPKFDVSSDMGLGDGLKALGVTDVFDPALADFSPMTRDMDGIFLSQAQHAARVTIDEEGCTAAAYTVMMACGSAMPPEEEVDFVLDRPFLFAITSTDGLPLFVGVVNRPV